MHLKSSLPIIWININLMLSLHYAELTLKTYSLILTLFITANCFALLPDSVFTSVFEKTAFENFHTDSSLKSQMAVLMAPSEGINQKYFETAYNQLLGFNGRHPLHQSPKKLFHTVQDSFLQQYKETAYLPQAFSDSVFSCVTGSALLAFYLELNGFEYTIKEQPEHVFVSATFKNKTYLLESTDEQFGFLKDNRVNRSYYEPDTLDNNYVFKMISSYSHLDEKGILVKSEIQLHELAGLNYFNEAVHALNSKDFARAALNLEKAHYLFPSKRITEMFKYCLLKLIEDRSIPFESRVLYLKRLSHLAYPLSAQ